MLTETVPTAPKIHYSLEIIKEEIYRLLKRKAISRQQPLYALCEYIPAREWLSVVCELERYDYLLRDRIGDLIGAERWEND